jgi:hypothetical protein
VDETTDRALLSLEHTSGADGRSLPSGLQIMVSFSSAFCSSAVVKKQSKSPMASSKESTGGETRSLNVSNLTIMEKWRG